MTRTIELGATFTRSHVVDEARTIGFLGPEMRVYATPRIVQDLEQACRDWLVEHIEPTHDSVGRRVEVEHKRPTPLGMTVTHAGKVVEIDGARITFEITVRDTLEEVATGRHTRVIVEKERMKQAVQAKGARMT
jgi:fluoroacetyl-CoA thioesterase